MSLRRCWKYTPVECSLADIKKGDVFQLESRDESDVECPAGLQLATSDSKKEIDGQSQNMVMAVSLVEKDYFERKLINIPREGVWCCGFGRCSKSAKYILDKPIIEHGQVVKTQTGVCSTHLVYWNKKWNLEEPVANAR
jgi:hypothetical protein